MQSKILDIHGNPFVFDDALQTENDSRLAWLARTYSEHPTSGLTPAKAARILRAAEVGDLVAQAELAEDMEEKDAHLQSELGKRRSALLTVDWKIVPPRNATPEEQRDADWLTVVLFPLDISVTFSAISEPIIPTVIYLLSCLSFDNIAFTQSANALCRASLLLIA